MVDDGYLNLMTLGDWPLFTMEIVMVSPHRNYSVAAKGTQECEDISRNDWEHPCAYSFSLSPSLKTFGADITLGIYREREVSSRNLQNLGAVDKEFGYGAQVPRWEMATDSFPRNGTWNSCNATVANTTANTIELHTLSAFTATQANVITLFLKCGIPRHMPGSKQEHVSAVPGIVGAAPP